MFGEFRIKTCIEAHGSNEFYDKMTEIADWCAENVKDMITYPGYKPGEVVWCFKHEDDAILFALKWT